MDGDREARRETRRRVCAVFDHAAADPSARGRRDAALVSVLFGAGVPRAVARVLTIDAWDPASATLAWRPDRKGGGGRREDTIRRRATDGARRALEAWRDVRGTEPGPLLCPLDRAGEPLLRPLAHAEITRILQARVDEAGVRTWSARAFRRRYDSPWWEEASRRTPAG